MAYIYSPEHSQAVMVILGYTFQNLVLLRRALETWSLGSPHGNKPLALVGDRAIAMVFSLDGYLKNATCGNTTQLLNSRSSNKTLHSLGCRHGLERYLVLNPSQSNVSIDTMANTVEALIGAVFIDSGFDLDAVKAAMINFGIMEAQPQE
ncbi:hypothetical protein N7508_004259 [Penicillium antarcticum]|uniref:uncharacterized protein n=1 Tax=Penicillium antarcticum TaxID=416450 RepID=UPI002396F635|nr:uncharacterized protein N7508_004259 [Penicillium antarcticum]KAJ5308880.1 hypothetical protein N7508_004259 [Penicillium antarcticum]